MKRGVFMELQSLIDSAEFANILGINVQKLNYQVSLGKIPMHDIVVGRTRLWSKKTVVDYLSSLQDSLQKSIDRVVDEK